MDIKESKKYLEDKLYEEYVLNTAIEAINKSSDKFGKDAIKTKDELVRALNGIKKPTRTYGIDIIKNAKDRYDLMVDKQAHIEEYVLSTGLDELDMILNGGIKTKEEFLVIYARTNNAKTWIAEKIAVSIWDKGKRNVGFFSPEMGADKIGYRFDTLFKNFDNHGIMGDSKDFNSEPYRKYINTLANKDRPLFNVTTPIDFPDKRVTVTELRNWVEELNLKALIIDGMQYLTNERGYGRKNTAENLTEIAEDLMILSVEMEIPVIAVLQANRMGARDADGEVNKESPELDTIRGSDGISHNATRAISVAKDKDIIKLYVSKNRYGEKGQKLIYQYDVNFGKFTYLPNPKDGLGIDTTKDKEEFSDDTGSPF